ncbi:MAG TPA: hypothetical protein VM098_04090 [Phycisphaerae bacterium]|nr:hypothetical protein [Phycisphaerae bacterium]
MMGSFAETLNGFGRWLVGRLWQMSLELAILAVVVVAVILLLRIRSPRLRHLFWCLVLAKPVAVFVIASPLSLYWFLRPEVRQPERAVAALPATPAAGEVRPGTVRWADRYRSHRGMAGSAPAGAEAASLPPERVTLDRYGTAAEGIAPIASATEPAKP